MEPHVPVQIDCRQCRKEIKTEACKCLPCEKYFHPSCYKQHKVYNRANELVPCEGRMEKYFINQMGENSKERKRLEAEEGRYPRERSSLTGMENKIDSLYKLVKEVKDEIIGKDMIRTVIMEAIKEEMDRVKAELQQWKVTDMESLISTVVKSEMQGIMSSIPMMRSAETAKKSYSETLKKKTESVIIVKPIDEKEETNSEATKRDIKSKIDISKLGVGITKIKKVTRGAVVVGCENKSQADKLKKEITKDLGEKYTIEAPKKKKLMIRIFDVNKEDSENEQEFWKKIEEQNDIRRGAINGKIVHKVTGDKRRGTVVAEVNAETREKLLEIGKLKIG